MSEIVFLVRVVRCEKLSKCERLFEKFSQIDYTDRVEKQTKRNTQTMIIDEKSIEKDEMRRSSSSKAAKAREF